MSINYAGFLSYAHVDEDIAARLHRSLETYKIPKGLSGDLTPIFRDANELTAHHSLPEKIKDAVTASRVLIVLCSPAAKVSYWVNEEIRLFRKIHGEAAILCVLADGSPETAFPPALLEDGREPLAANLGNTRESFHLGVTQIAAAMLGVGLDTLIQREAQRKRRRLQIVTAGALVFSTVMGGMTLSAITARQAADANRMQAEGLVEYMITDLKEKLEPVGRLDILDGIGQRAVDYYDAQDISKLPDDSLARQARSRHILGQVALDAGAVNKARSEIEAAARLTQEVLNRNPDDTDSIFAHAQSEFWMGEVFYRLDDRSNAKPHWQAYADLGKRLHSIDENNFDWTMERAWGANNLALLYNRSSQYENAKEKYLEAIRLFEVAAEMKPDNYQANKELANSLEGLAQVSLQVSSLEEVLSLRQKQLNIYETLSSKRPNDYFIRFQQTLARSRLVTDGLLDDDLYNLKKTIDVFCAEYDDLIKHDPTNQTWRREYILALNAFLRHLEEKNLEAIDADDLKRRIIYLENN